MGLLGLGVSIMEDHFSDLSVSSEIDLGCPDL